MILPKQLKEIRAHLEASQNPLFFFDNDVDGLCAFLILQRTIGRGRGVAIKSFPDLKEQYLKKVEELNPDSIFILDKPELSKEFIEGVEEKGIPVTWIDHHETKTPKEIIEKTSYFNSLPSAEPTTYIAQKIFNRQEDQWLAIIGCIGDVYMPDFAEKFSEENPELLNSQLSAFDALHSSEIGKMVRMLNFGLMDSTTNVVKLIKYLFKAKNAYDLLEENQYTKQFQKRYSQLNEFYNKQINKAEANFNPKSTVLFFSYSGETSMSSEIANKLYYNHKDKLIIVAFKRPEKINISIRGENALKITKEAIKDIDGATGGGHENATGAMVPIDDFERFKENINQITA
ncbi:DHH family phosphoesterase [Candidatus Pacearchaeota archaeon]|nr:DHH family phosphoesterase [Candidatus Pacearchaeota archaeon]